MSTVSKILFRSTVYVVTATLLEQKVLRSAVPYLYEPSELVPALPRAVGLLAFPLVFFANWHVMYGVKHVATARQKFKDLAAKDGEPDVDRYELPNLYVAGTSKHAKAFNSRQRAHQQVLETLSHQYMVILFASLAYPMSTLLCTCIWVYARMNYAAGYAEGGPSGRYNMPLTLWIW
eukprot:CAMPEP_0116845848 /NCGR_PEP_ID=MMETSP0418-20121206/13507_1 /TAXON_ID=1158023 /ORGANISM="Astrosyne radiata, Strain 13vi08-1A" /LENGTH=176 /DNA_ID=CAMNT_0004477029 /DNA_START=181 /DNA_END=708 /DNA_ORIENTATION=+